MVRAAECDITIDSNELITNKKLTASILYYYEEEKLARKHTILVDGNEWVFYYEYTGEEQDGETVDQSGDGSMIDKQTET